MRTRALLLTAALSSALALAGCGDRATPDATSAGDPTTSANPDADANADADADETDAASPAQVEIPDDFPLSDGMGGADDTIATARTGTGLRDLALCGTSPLRGLSTRDRMVADNSGGEAANTRELVLLGSPDEAALVARAFTDLPATCGASDSDTQTATDVRASPFGPAPASTLVQTYTFDGRPGDGATVIHVVPVGAALLVTSTYGQWTSDGLEDGVAETTDAVRRTVAALAGFGEVPSPTADPSSADPSTADPSTADPSTSPTAVPADFPLGVGLPADDGETKVSPPSADGDGMGEVEMCGRVVWPLGDSPGGTGRLVTGALGPEYFDGRELVVHADAEAAAEAMAVFRRAVRDCHTVDNQVWTALDRDVGHDTVTVGLTYDDGLGSSLFQVTRVGSARLMVSTYGEGTLASLDQQADQVTGTTSKIVPAMCVFTKTGC